MPTNTILRWPTAAKSPFPLDPSGGYIYQYYPEAVFKQDQLITSVNARVNKNLSLVGFYTAGWANSDGGAGSNVSNAYDLGQDYGPATFVSRNQVFSMANYSGPWKLRFNSIPHCAVGQALQHHAAQRSR